MGCLGVFLLAAITNFSGVVTLSRDDLPFYFVLDEKTGDNWRVERTKEKISVGDYEGYLATCASFLESKYAEYNANPLSYFGGESFLGMTWEQFKEESSNYAYLFKPIITEETKEKDKKK